MSPTLNTSSIGLINQNLSMMEEVPHGSHSPTQRHHPIQQNYAVGHSPKINSSKHLHQQQNYLVNSASNGLMVGSSHLDKASQRTTMKNREPQNN